MNTIKNYRNVFNDLKATIKNARLRSSLTVNTQLLQLYWQMGSVILHQQETEGWGTKVIDRLAADLQSEFPDMQGLSVRNFKYMRAFAEAYPQFTIVQQPVAQLPENNKLTGKRIVKKDLSNELQKVQIVQQVVAQLPWGHNCTLLDKLKTNEERWFYALKTLENGWSRNILNLQITHNLYKRQGKSINNFKVTIPKQDSDLVNEMFKNPYFFDLIGFSEKMQETDLEKALVANVTKLMLEMGKGFAFVGNQYNIKVGNRDRSLDLLFYNYRLYRFVVVEIKTGEFTPEHAGKLNFYINAVDDLVKGKKDKRTLGLLLCRTPDQVTIRYSLQGIKTPISVSDYNLVEKLPKDLKGEFPTIAEIESKLGKEMKMKTNKRFKNINKENKILKGDNRR